MVMLTAIVTSAALEGDAPAGGYVAVEAVCSIVLIGALAVTIRLSRRYRDIRATLRTNAWRPVDGVWSDSQRSNAANVLIRDPATGEQAVLRTPSVIRPDPDVRARLWFAGDLRWGGVVTAAGGGHLSVVHWHSTARSVQHSLGQRSCGGSAGCRTRAVPAGDVWTVLPLDRRAGGRRGGLRHARAWWDVGPDRAHRRGSPAASQVPVRRFPMRRSGQRWKSISGPPDARGKATHPHAVTGLRTSWCARVSARRSQCSFLVFPTWCATARASCPAISPSPGRHRICLGSVRRRSLTRSVRCLRPGRRRGSSGTGRVIPRSSSPAGLHDCKASLRHGLPRAATVAARVTTFAFGKRSPACSQSAPTGKGSAHAHPFRSPRSTNPSSGAYLTSWMADENFRKGGCQ